MILLIILQLAIPSQKLTPGFASQVKTENLCPESKVLKAITPITEIVQNKVLLNYGYLNNGKSYYIDILVPLELGGEVVLNNLWPIPYETRRETIIKKSALEHKLHDLVCSGTITLKDAQGELKSNWALSYQKYFPEVQ